MSTSFFLQIADSIVQELNEAAPGTFAQPLGTVSRIYDSERFPEELQNLVVDVVIGKRTANQADRGSRLNECPIDIAFRQVTLTAPNSPERQAEGDALVYLAEQVENFFADPPRRLQYCPQAMWEQSEQLAPYVMVDLQKHQQWTGVLRLTYTRFSPDE
jgi:hypothetical protein